MYPDGPRADKIDRVYTLFGNSYKLFIYKFYRLCQRIEGWQMKSPIKQCIAFHPRLTIPAGIYLYTFSFRQMFVHEGEQQV